MTTHIPGMSDRKRKRDVLKKFQNDRAADTDGCMKPYGVRIVS